jgi:ABC-type sugar transport system permease subunit
MMLATGVLREACACYIVFTLMVTGLAKLRGLQASAVTVARQRIVPLRLASLTVVVGAITELLLATLLSLDVKPAVVGSAIAGLFFLFGCYRVLAAAKTKSLTCACAGKPEYSPATPRAVIGTITSSLLQVFIACLWTLLSRNPFAGFAGFQVAGMIAWACPLAILPVAGIWRMTQRQNRRGTLAQLP